MASTLIMHDRVELNFMIDPPAVVISIGPGSCPAMAARAVRLYVSAACLAVSELN